VTTEIESGLKAGMLNPRARQLRRWVARRKVQAGRPRHREIAMSPQSLSMAPIELSLAEVERTALWRLVCEHPRCSPGCSQWEKFLPLAVESVPSLLSTLCAPLAQGLKDSRTSSELLWAPAGHFPPLTRG